MIPELRALGQAESNPDTAADPVDEGPTAPSIDTVSTTELQGEDDTFAPNPGDHPEIAEQKKQLVAAFHKRISKADQDQADKFKDFDAYKREAEAFRVLMSNKDVAEKLGGKQPSEPTGLSPGGLMPLAKDVLSRLPSYAKDSVQADFQEAVTNHVLGVLEAIGAPQLVQTMNMLLGERQKTETQRVTSELVGAEPYMAKAQEFADRHGVTLRQALLAVGDGKVSLKPTQRTPDVPALRSNGRPTPAAMTQRSGPNGNVNEADVIREMLELDAKSENPKYMGNVFRSG